MLIMTYSNNTEAQKDKGVFLLPYLSLLLAPPAAAGNTSANIFACS